MRNFTFLSTPSARRATQEIYAQGTAVDISIHALREEGDGSTQTGNTGALDFYPRPPRGGRRPGKLVLDCVYLFLSTPSARRATHHCKILRCSPSISIHALREEGDAAVYIKRLTEIISIHALREEGDCCAPTPAMSPCNFYPRPPRGGRPLKTEDYQKVIDISIHALREEGDGDPLQPVHRQRISIHALREEGDIPADGAELDYFDFYPRPPRGGRPQRKRRPTEHGKFLSTPSARRATSAEAAANRAWQISIHALREEGDP